jgi:FkbM family methyltransferase
MFNPALPEGREIIEIVKRFSYSKAIVNWFIDRGDATLRVDYPLNHNSIVFDVGGYVGGWAEYIREKYDPYIYVYEPNPECTKILLQKFQNQSKILIYPFGLGDQNTTAMLNIEGIGSSIYTGGTSSQYTKIELRDIKQVVADTGVKKIDLMKINIEGGEYALLERMMETGIIGKCGELQIQFHEWYPEARALREKIVKSLSLSHYRTWNYPFVWENWKRIEKLCIIDY